MKAVTQDFTDRFSFLSLSLSLSLIISSFLPEKVANVADHGLGNDAGAAIHVAQILLVKM